jgi:5-oxoprolinase (ATP-hydrolysing) subunit A
MADRLGWVALGDRAIRFARPGGSSPRTLVRRVLAWPGVADVVVTRHDVAVYFDGSPVVDPQAIETLHDPCDDNAPTRTVDLPSVYDGADLADLAVATRLSVDSIIGLHASGTYEVETMGFSPGFAYLTGLDPRLHVDRRATPRTRVPAGTIALAGGYTGVYPFESPGGWHLIGRVVGVKLFGEDGALLRLGDRVRFVR